MKNENSKSKIVKEILRFCKILTQSRYDKDEDAMFKMLILENLNNIEIPNEVILNKRTKRDYVEGILQKCKILIHCKYNSVDDIEMKTLISKDLCEISKLETMSHEAREKSKGTAQLQKWLSCV